MTYAEAEKILLKYYPEGSLAYEYLYPHSLLVASLALKIAKQNPQLNADLNFIETAAFLHDIGIFQTHAPKFGCHGSLPYLAHGYLGRNILEKEGYPEHALVCERHVGVGISKEDVIINELPLPERDMRPQSIEEEIICYADKFYSKNPDKINITRTPEEILKKLEKYGEEKPGIFRGFMEKFGTWL
jgi:uncharacterized protein